MHTYMHMHARVHFIVGQFWALHSTTPVVHVGHQNAAARVDLPKTARAPLPVAPAGRVAPAHARRRGTLDARTARERLVEWTHHGLPGARWLGARVAGA